MVRHWYRVITACALLALAVPAVANAQTSSDDPDWARVLEAANREGKVIVYANPVPPVITRLRADFQKAYPLIDIQIVRIAAAPDVVATAQREHDAGLDGADAVIATDGATAQWFEQHAKDHLLTEPIGPDAKAYPAQYLRRGGSTPIFALEPLVISYNANLVKTPITGYADLLRPELKDRIGTSDLISPTISGWYVWLEHTQGPDFLQKFAAQHPRLYNGGVPAVQAAAAGEIVVAAFSNATNTNPLIATGAPMKVVVPTPSFGIAYTGAVLSWSKRPNAAQVLLNYLMSPRGQATWSGTGDTASPLPGIPGSLDPKTIDTTNPLTNDPGGVAAFKERWTTMLKAN